MAAAMVKMNLQVYTYFSTTSSRVALTVCILLPYILLVMYTQIVFEWIISNCYMYECTLTYYNTVFTTYTSGWCEVM